MKTVAFQADAETELIEAATYYEAQQYDPGKTLLDFGAGHDWLNYPC
jgi:hypothetical protein